MLTGTTGSGAVETLMRAVDWAKTPLGEPATWPQSLKVALRIVLGSPTAMWLGWGPDLTFFYNDAYARMSLAPEPPSALGRPAREAFGESWADIGPRAEHVLRTGEATRDKGLRPSPKQPGFAPASHQTFACSPLPDDAGGVGGVLCVVTEEGDSAEALRASEEQDRRKDEFLATLAHELRNPLAPLSIGLHVLKVASSAEAVERAREVMDRQITLMVRLIDDLLDASRLSRGKFELKRQAVDVRTVLEDALEASRPLLKEARHRPVVSFPKEPLPLHADPARMAQVVSNLLSNAAKYTPEGGNIELSAERDKGDAVIRVRDNGMGIPADKLANVFDLFNQVSRSLGRPQGGLGIGLALVRKIVELHGGSVSGESDGPDRGSTFTVRLPLAVTDAPMTSGSPVTLEKARPNPSGCRVLVVDDNEDGAESLSELLAMKGHQTALAHSGPAALEVARQFKPEVVLLDIGLHGMTGYEVAARLRAEPEQKGIVLVALTGWGGETEKRKAQEAGFDFHLTKPADTAKIEAILAQAATRTPSGSKATS